MRAKLAVLLAAGSIAIASTGARDAAASGFGRPNQIGARAMGMSGAWAAIADDPDWLRLLSEDGESVILALAIACRRPPEWVSGLSLDDAIRLAEAVFGANADFFIRRVVPEITRVSQTLGTLIHGQMPSPGSSDPATVTPTS